MKKLLTRLALLMILCAALALPVFADAVTGSISFDANGDAIKSTAYIKQAIDGGFQFYKVQNAD